MNKMKKLYKTIVNLHKYKVANCGLKIKVQHNWVRIPIL